MDKIFEAKGKKRIIKTDIKSIKTNNEIICISDLALPYGRRLGFRKCGRFLETSLQSDYNISVYADDYNIRAEETHENGVNFILFREIKPELSKTQVMNFYKKLAQNDLSCVSHYTNSLLKYIR